MRDYTLGAYRHYLELLKDAGFCFKHFRDWMSGLPKEEKICLIRHDVDRKPLNALRMAQLELDMDIVATYYFRIKKNVFKPEIIKMIEAMGHEIGYHYENMSDTNGDKVKAFADFKRHLAIFREVANISTISMHGRPLKPYDNRDLWRDDTYHCQLKEIGIRGEVYLDIDYSDFAYINDTGRNWTSDKNNRRDKVDSNKNASFETQKQLIKYLSTPEVTKIVFQIHPERWTDAAIEWYLQYFLDAGINTAKMILR